MACASIRSYRGYVGSSFRPDLPGYETVSTPEMWQGDAQRYSLPAPTAVGAVTGRCYPQEMSYATAARPPIHNNNTPTMAATQQVNTGFFGLSAPQYPAHCPTAVDLDSNLNFNQFLVGQINSLTRLLQAAN
jgi:hypothetical protein